MELSARKTTGAEPYWSISYKYDTFNTGYRRSSTTSHIQSHLITSHRLITQIIIQKTDLTIFLLPTHTRLPV